MNVPEGGSFFLYEFAVHPRRNLIIGADAESHVEPKVMDVLCVLIDRRGEVLSREDLLSLVWGDDGGDERLTRAISQLRKAFNDKARTPRFIETVPKRGYRLICPVTVEHADDVVPRAGDAPDPVAAPASELDRRSMIVLGGCGLIVILSLVVAAVALS